MHPIGIIRQNNTANVSYVMVVSLKSVNFAILHKEWLVMLMRGGKENRLSGALNIFTITELPPS